MSGFDSRWLEQHQAKQGGNDPQTRFKAKSMLAKLDEESKAKARLQKKKAKEEADRHFVKVCMAAGLPAPVAEYPFQENRKWRIDYYFSNKVKRVALEVEGGVHSGGRHTHSTGFLKDMEKYNALSAQGIYLVRTTPANLYTQGIKDVLAVFESEENEAA